MALAVIRVFSTADQKVLAAHGQLITSRYGLPTVTYCIPDQPLGIYDDATEQQAAPKIVAAAQQAEANGAKAVLISCAVDPAVAECRQVLSIPVIGAGSSAAALAIALGNRVGVLNLTGSVHPRIARLLGNRFTCEQSPQGIANTADLLSAEGLQAARKAAAALSKQADVIVFTCTGFTTIGLAALLRQDLSIPIVDAVEAGGGVAWQLLAER